MLSAKISTFQTTKYTEDELANMTRDEYLHITKNGYEKIVQEIELVNQTFQNVDQLRNKVLELCQENSFVFVVLDSSLEDGFLVGKHHYRDPNGVFEVIFFTIIDKSRYNQSVISDIHNGIINHPSIRELFRTVGRDLRKVTYYDIQYAKLHKLSNSCATSNLLYDHPPLTWHKMDPSYRGQKEQLRLAKQRLQEERNKKLDSSK